MRFHRTNSSTRAALVAALTLAIVVVLAGCGGVLRNDDKSPIQKAYGGSSDKDMVAMQAVRDEFRGFLAGQDAFFVAIDDEDLPKARSALGAMYAGLDQTQERVLDVDNTKLRSAIQGYTATMRTHTRAVDRLLAYRESGKVDKRREDKLATKAANAANEAHAADRKFLAALLEAASPEQREVLRKEAAERAAKVDGAAPVEDSRRADLLLLGTTLGAFLRHYTDHIQGLEADDYPRSRAALEKIEADGAEVRDLIPKLDSSSLRATAQDYVTRMAAIVRTADRRLAYYEDPGGRVDKRLERRLSRQFWRAMSKLYDHEVKLLEDVLEELDAEDQEQVEQEYDDAINGMPK